MANMDVDTLFTNIPLEETIGICVGNLFNDNENPTNIPKHDFGNLLNIPKCFAKNALPPKKLSLCLTTSRWCSHGISIRSSLSQDFYVNF